MTPKEARALIEAKLNVTPYQVKRFIARAARKRWTRTPGRFFPSRSKVWEELK